MRDLILAVCTFALLVALECPVLLAQAELAKPVSETSDLSIQTCDSLKNPAPGESLTDAANWHNAFWHCLKSRVGLGQWYVEGRFTAVDMDNRQFVAGTVPVLVDSQSRPAARKATYFPNPIPNNQPYTFTVRSGPWSKVISASQVLRESHRFLEKLGLTRKTPQPLIQ
jgi:hypothetical protein